MSKTREKKMAAGHWTATIFIALIVGAIILSPVLEAVGGSIDEIIEDHKARGQLRIYHWWTAGGEREGIDAAFDHFAKQYPNVKVLSAPVSGGAGTNLKQIVKTQVVAGNAPEAFQCHPGYEMYPYYDADLLYPCNDVWGHADLEEKTPKVVQDVCKIGGDYYAVPIGVHRTNVVWYNKAMFKEYGIKPPEDPVTFDDFWGICDELSKKLPKGKYPLALGDRNNWPATHIFETLMAGVSPQTYENFINGKVTPQELEPVLEAFQKYLSYVPPDHRARTWDEACGMVCQGKCAMYIHGDWAKGYFVTNGWEYGVDYGTFPAPGTSDWYGLDADSFVRPKNSVNPKNGIRWQWSYTTQESQMAFNPPKGSVSPYRDVSTDIYDAYSKESAEALCDPHMRLYPSIAHGHGSPEKVVSNLNVIIGDFAQNPTDISGTARGIASRVRRVDHPIAWGIVE